MNISEYFSYDALGLAELVRTKQISSIELLEVAIDLTKKLDKILAKYPKNGRMDGYIGFGLGCIYAAAKEARQ